MPLLLRHGGTTLLIQREAFQRVALTRADLDARFNLTDEEFRVEGGLICVGPIHGEPSLEGLVAELEGLGLVHFDDFFDLSGNWPGWIALYAMESRRGL